MAHCVISAIIDTDAGNALVPACMIHTTYAPCQHDGEPACPTLVHAFSGVTPRAEALRIWRLRTHGQRPLVIHNVVLAMEAEDHECGQEYVPCPCGAEVIAAGLAGDSHA